MIEPTDIEYLTSFFVKKDECGYNREKLDEKLDIQDKQLTTIATKLNMLLGILSVIGTAVVGIAIKLLFGGTI